MKSKTVEDMNFLKDNLGDIMKILYDHQIFTQQKYGGISRYIL